MEKPEPTIFNLSDAELQELGTHTEAQFSVPWQYDGASTSGRPEIDADGFDIKGAGGGLSLSREQLLKKIFQKFYFNPHVNTSTRGIVGRIVGEGFATVSEIPEIEDAVEEIEEDYRNRLYDYWPKFLTRTFLSGELFLCFTVHEDGFIEIDYVNPDTIDDSKADNGIIFHPSKTRMPLVYILKDKDKGIDEHIPSIYMARYPELWSVAREQKDFDQSKLNGSRSRKFKSLGNYYRFIVSWDLGLITNRSTSHLITILEWLNHWENLKKYEIDHKKSSGAYVHVVRFTDVKSWVTWLGLTDEQRAKTGIAAPKTPGGTLVLGPNIEHKIENPTLPKISEGDSDIMQMISSGLNEPADVTTGQAKGTFASVKASRGPMSDKVSDEKTYFGRWLIHDFWGNVFFLKSKVSDFPERFKVRKAVGFKNKKAIFKEVDKKPEKCIEILFPISAIEDLEGITKSLLGVKHGSLYDTAGVPNKAILKRIGFKGYGKLRLEQEEEKDKYPDTILTIDQESFQEQGLEPANDNASDDNEDDQE